MSKIIMRHMIGDYIKTGESGSTTTYPVYSLCGVGFSQLDENPSAQVETEAYISDKAASSTITGYENAFPFDTKFISDEAAVAFIYHVARNQLTGSDAETDLVRVDLYDGESESSTVYPARKFRVAVEVSEITGEGAKPMRVTGTLHQIGDFTEGFFDTAAVSSSPTADAFTTERPTPPEPHTGS